MEVPKILRRGSGASIVSALGACFVAVLLLSLSIPRFIAALTEVPGNVTLRAIGDRNPVTRKDLERLVKSREAAAAWIGSSRLRGDLALARLMLWEGRASGGPRAAAQLEIAISDLRDSLAHAPANPYAWARLALARKLFWHSGVDASRALAMSFLTGPREPELIEIRTRLTFDLWPEISAEDRRLAQSHIRFGFLVNPRLIVSLAGETVARGIVKDALAASPGQLKKFENLIRRKRT